jgi:hypothetical protein
MKQQINEFKRMQLIAGLITESEYRESLNEEETIFADYSTNNDNSIKTKLARNLAEEIHSLDVKEGTIDSLFTGEMEQYAEGNDDFYANKEESLKAFAELPDTFTIMHNIDGNKVKISITKTGPKSWKVNEMDEAKKMNESILKVYVYDPSSYKLEDVETYSYPSEEEAKKAAVAHNWQIAHDDGDTDLSKEEYIQKYSWDDLDDISYDNYGYEIVK